MELDKITRIALFAFSATLFVGWLVCASDERNTLKTHENTQISNVSDKGTLSNKEKEWDLFVNALIRVESNGKHDAVGTKDDVGVLQITPICLQQANNIVGYARYSLNDRLDSLKSVEMFNVIQDKMNPEHDFHFALKIWNSKAPISYHEKVMNEYKKLKKDEKVL